METSAKLQFFSGFYESIWSAEYELADFEFEEGLEYDEDYDFDYDAYKDAVGERVTQIYQEWVRECIGYHVHVKYDGITSPAYYNYSTDSLDVIIEFDEVGKREILRAFEKNYFAIASMIAKECDDCPGYWSWLTNEYSDWTDDKLFDDSERQQPVYLSSLLDYIIRAEFRKQHFDDSENHLNYIAYEEAEIYIHNYITLKNNKATA